MLLITYLNLSSLKNMEFTLGRPQPLHSQQHYTILPKTELYILLRRKEIHVLYFICIRFWVLDLHKVRIIHRGFASSWTNSKGLCSRKPSFPVLDCRYFTFIFCICNRAEELPQHYCSRPVQDTLLRLLTKCSRFCFFSNAASVVS